MIWLLKAAIKRMITAKLELVMQQNPTTIISNKKCNLNSICRACLKLIFLNHSEISKFLVFSLSNILLHTISNVNLVEVFIWAPTILTDSENPGCGPLESVKKNISGPKLIWVIIQIWNRSLSWYIFSLTHVLFFFPSLSFCWPLFLIAI